MRGGVAAGAAVVAGITAALSSLAVLTGKLTQALRYDGQILHHNWSSVQRAHTGEPGMCLRADGERARALSRMARRCGGCVWRGRWRHRSLSAAAQVQQADTGAD